MNLFILNDSLVPQHDIFNIKIINDIVNLEISNDNVIINCPSIINLQNYFIESPFIFSESFDFIVNNSINLEKESEKKLLSHFNTIKIVNSLESTDNKILNIIFNYVSRCTNEELIAFKFEGVDVGQYCFTDLSLGLKSGKSPADFDIIELNFVKLILFYNVVLLNNINDFLNKNIMYLFVNNVYSSHNSAISFIKNKSPLTQIRFYEPDVYNYQSVKIFENPVKDNILRRAFSCTPFDHDSVENYYSHAKTFLEQRISKPNVFSYSPSIGEEKFSNIRDVLNLTDTTKKIVVYFSNSSDEIISSQTFIKTSPEIRIPNNSLPFSDEFICISQLAEFCFQNNMYLIVRLHPRLDSENRNSRKSSELPKYLSLLSNLKHNYSIVCIEPQSKISSYWLGVWADYCFTFRGTLPTEFALLGITSHTMSSNFGLINYFYHTLDTMSLKSKDDIKKICSKTIFYNNDYHKDSIRDFYYINKLGYINLFSSNSNNEILRSVLDGYSLQFYNYSIKGISPNCDSSFIDYINWLREFIKNYIASHEDLRLLRDLDSLVISC